MILSGNTIRRFGIFTPFCERTVHRGMSYGLSHAGYDVRISLEGVRGVHANAYGLAPGEFLLASTIEHFTMPPQALAIVHDKSTWARRGLALQNTVVEPGWRGWLTIELTNHGSEYLFLHHGDPIAQLVFHQVDEPTTQYAGKYQDQDQGPVQARTE